MPGEECEVGLNVYMCSTCLSTHLRFRPLADERHLLSRDPKKGVPLSGCNCFAAATLRVPIREFPLRQPHEAARQNASKSHGSRWLNLRLSISLVCKLERALRGVVRQSNSERSHEASARRAVDDMPHACFRSPKLEFSQL